MQQGFPRAEDQDRSTGEEPEIYRLVEYNAYAEAKLQHDEHGEDRRHQPLDGFVSATVRRPMSKRDSPCGPKLRLAQQPALRFPSHTHTHRTPGPITNITAMPEQGLFA